MPALRQAPVGERAPPGGARQLALRLLLRELLHDAALLTEGSPVKNPEKFARRMSDLFARATNLADQTARRHTSFVKDRAPLPGIGGVLGARLEF